MIVFIPWLVFECLTIINSVPSAFSPVVPPDYNELVNLIEDPEEKKMLRIQVDNEYHEKGLFFQYTHANARKKIMIIIEKM